MAQNEKAVLGRKAEFLASFLSKPILTLAFDSGILPDLGDNAVSHRHKLDKGGSAGGNGFLNAWKKTRFASPARGAKVFRRFTSGSVSGERAAWVRPGARREQKLGSLWRYCPTLKSDLILFSRNQ